MAVTQTKRAKLTDHHGRCRDCGAALHRTETIITYWDYSESVEGRTVSEKGISEIDVHAGICENCQVRKMRKRLENRQRNAQGDVSNAPGGSAVIGLGIGIFVFTLFLLLKLTRVDEFGNAMPYFTTWFYIWAAADLACVIALPIARRRSRKLCRKELSAVGEELKLSDGELFSRYAAADGKPFMKLAWSEYMIEGSGRGKGGLAYASELLQMGTAEKIAKTLRVDKDLAAQLLSAAYTYRN